MVGIKAKRRIRAWEMTQGMIIKAVHTLNGDRRPEAIYYRYTHCKPEQWLQAWEAHRCGVMEPSNAEAAAREGCYTVMDVSDRQVRAYYGSWRTYLDTVKLRRDKMEAERND